MSGDWSIDRIIHALPSPAMRQQAMREIHLAALGRLEEVVAKWQAEAERWVTQEAPRIEEARAHIAATGHLPDDLEGETLESVETFDAWRQNLEHVRQQRGAA